MIIERLGKVPQEGIKIAKSILFTSLAAKYHLRYIKPACEINPPLYKGIPESMLLALLLNIGGVKEKDLKKDSEKSINFFRLMSAFNLQWRAYDEFVDMQHNTVNEITENELDETLVDHKRWGRKVNGKQAIEIANQAVANIFPKDDLVSNVKRNKIAKLMSAARRRFLDVANNPRFNTGEILSVEDCLESKKQITGYLGQVGTEIAFIALGIDDPEGIKLFSQAVILMQWEDDISDARKDEIEHQNQIKQYKDSGKAVRPRENLFLSVLENFEEEKKAFFEHLFDESEKTVLLIRKLAPKALAESLRLIEIELDELVDHPYTKALRGIMEIFIYDSMPTMPEKGKLVDWVKY